MECIQYNKYVIYSKPSTGKVRDCTLGSVEEICPGEGSKVYIACVLITSSLDRCLTSEFITSESSTIYNIVINRHIYSQ